MPTVILRKIINVPNISLIFHILYLIYRGMLRYSVFPIQMADKCFTVIGFNPFRSYVGPRPTLWFSCSRRFSLSLTLSNPIFLPPAYSPTLIYFGRERGWWVTCNYPTVLKDKNRNRKSTTYAICWPKSVLHEKKRREQKIITSDFVRHYDFPVPGAFPHVGRTLANRKRRLYSLCFCLTILNL
jgi:hypothetical protein